MKFKFCFHVLCVLGMILVTVMWSETLLNNSYLKKLETIDKVPGLLYVLQWTSPSTEPFKYLKKGQETFVNRNCTKTNCYVTSNRYLLKDVKSFDAILFHGPEIIRKKFFVMSDLPKERSPQQSYIFASMESSAYYPVADGKYNNYFNYSWTYKLDSDIYYGYMIIRDEVGKVIGPSTNIQWINVTKMLPVKQKVKAKLAKKKIAAAWFVSNCNTPNKRSELANKVIKELEKYNMVVDVYGKCGTKECLRDTMKSCLRSVQRDYYFYFAFENSNSEDYVTEKLLHALQNYAVPVVFGGADYKRFMPDGIYLNAAKLSVRQLVYQMVGIINDKNRYHDYFKWHNHYSYHNPEESIDTDPYCRLCDFINNVPFQNQSSTIDNFKDWWNPRV